MHGRPSYDGDLQMFVLAPRDPDGRRLRFLRWLAEQGRLEHAVAGPSTGPLAARTSKSAGHPAAGDGRRDDRSAVVA